MSFLLLFECLLALWLGYLLVSFVVFLVADGDITLMFKDKFGKLPDDLKGKVVWITGASSGIGEYLAYEFARLKCQIILSARRTDKLQSVIENCTTEYNLPRDNIILLPLDVTDFDTHAAKVEEVLSKFQQVDILVNNAGKGQKSVWAETDLEVDRQLWNTNVLGPVSLTRAMLPHMKTRKQGHIVVVSSIAGKMGVPMSGAYCATKFGVNGCFSSLAAEIAPYNIDVTTACPGPVESEIFTSALTEKIDKATNADELKNVKRMSTQRCAHLIVVSIVNKLSETWIAENPYLLSTYLAQYLPSIHSWLMINLGARVVDHVRRGNSIASSLKLLFSRN